MSGHNDVAAVAVGDEQHVSFRHELLRKGIHMMSLSIPIVYYFVTKEVMLWMLVPLMTAFLIGDVLRQLDAMGVARNTIVVFTSDNGGDANGRNVPFKGGKSSVFEGGIRAPLHIRWPGVIPAGRATPQVAMTMDLAPTLLGAAGGRGRGAARGRGGERASVQLGLTDMRRSRSSRRSVIPG